MVKRVQWIGAITADADAFIGRQREVTVDTTTNELRLHDGATAGGHRILNKSQNDALYMPRDQADFTDVITVDEIAEHTGNAGVTVDGVLIKDGEVDGVDISAFETAVLADITAIDTLLDTHIANVANPHAVTKTQVGLANVSNDAQLKIASNLSDLADVPTARANLGLGSIALLSTITSANITDGTIATADIANDQITYAKMQNVSAASRLIGRGSASGAGDPQEITPGAGVTMSSTTLLGSVLQVSRTTSTTYNPVTASIPDDDTIPQNTEGEQVLSLAFTPVSASSTLYIKVRLKVGGGQDQVAVGALFSSASASAIAAGMCNGSSSLANQTLCIDHSVASGSTSARTYTVRLGSVTGSEIDLNGNTSNRLFGGIYASSMEIWEVLT